MYGLCEEHGIDATGARPAHDIGQDAEAQAMYGLDPLEQRAIDCIDAAARSGMFMEVTTCSGELP